MRNIIIVLSLFILTACSPTPMSKAAKTAFTACLDKNWVPTYFSNGTQINFTCTPTNLNSPPDIDTVEQGSVDDGTK